MTTLKPKTGFHAFITSDHNNFLALLLTTPISTLLLYSSLNGSQFSGPLFTFIVQNRPTVQSAVQLIANLLSMCQILTICRLINYGVRMHLARKNMTLDSLRAWIDAMVPRVNWDLPFKYLVPLALFVAVSILMSALWAAALTPVEVWEGTDGRVTIPSWKDVSLVREYPSEVGKEGPTLQNLKGRFSYSIGIQLLGSLLAGAFSATPIDGSRRVHAKMDRSKFSYLGRSYGVGSSAGLVDEDILEDELAIGYAYYELGYTADVKCIYNESSGFALHPTNTEWVYAAQGLLPDSDSGREYSSYIGYKKDRIVAIGVAHFPDSEQRGVLPLRRYLAFAAGSSYDFLDKVQCEVDFTPSRFNVTVNLKDRSIAVQATNETNVTDIDPARHIKGSVMRQFELIANDQTNIYVSTVGTAFNASITDLRMYNEATYNSSHKTDAQVILEAVENSITVMTDDMLGAYAAAQLMVGNITTSTPATIRVSAIAIGEKKFCVAVFVINAAVVLLVLFEVARTKAWGDIPEFDVADVRHVIVAALQGGTRPGGVDFPVGAGHASQSEIGGIPFRYTMMDGDRFAIVADERKKRSTRGCYEDIQLSTRMGNGSESTTALVRQY